MLPPSPPDRYRSVSWHLPLVIAIAFLARFPIVWALDTITTGWHAADYGSVARNYFEHGFNFFYPQIDWGGDGPGYVEMEFPLVPYLTALIYAVVGVADDRWAVVVPFICGLITAGYSFRLGVLCFGSTPALVGAMLVAVSPVYVRYTQLTFPEGPLLAASAAAMYYVMRWQQEGRRAHLLVGGLCASLAILVKPTALILGVPFAWLFWLRDGYGVLRNPMLYVFGFVVLLPPVLWYYHALTIAWTWGNSFGVLFGGGSSKMWQTELLVRPQFYVKLAARLTLYHLTVVGMLAALYALVRHRFTPLQRTVVIWAGSTLVSFLIVTMGNDETAYYQLPIVIPACLLAGVGLVAMHRDISERLPSRYRRAASLTLVGATVAGIALGTVEHFTRSDYVWYTRPGKLAAQALVPVLRPGARIIFSENQGTRVVLPRGQHVTPPVPFYFSGHKGWYLSTEWVTIPELALLIDRGAEYFIVGDIKVFQKEQPIVAAWLEATCTRIPARAPWVGWDLRITKCGAENPTSCPSY